MTTEEKRRHLQEKLSEAAAALATACQLADELGQDIQFMGLERQVFGEWHGEVDDKPDRWNSSNCYGEDWQSSSC